MPAPNYRVLLSFDTDRKVFTARAPELEHCSAEGATRGEAITRLEEEIHAQIENILASGANPPAAVDEMAATSGELTIKLSQTLARELAWMARMEGVDAPQLASEMLAAGVEARRGGGRSQGRPGSRPVDGNRGDGNRGDGSNRGRGFGGHYNPVMDDRANFIEYVRNLEHTGGGGGGGGMNRNRRRGRGGGGGGGRGPHGGGGNGGNGRQP